MKWLSEESLEFKYLRSVLEGGNLNKRVLTHNELPSLFLTEYKGVFGKDCKLPIPDTLVHRVSAVGISHVDTVLCMHNSTKKPLKFSTPRKIPKGELIDLDMYYIRRAILTFDDHKFRMSITKTDDDIYVLKIHSRDKQRFIRWMIARGINRGDFQVTVRIIHTEEGPHVCTSRMFLTDTDLLDYCEDEMLGVKRRLELRIGKLHIARTYDDSKIAYVSLPTDFQTQEESKEQEVKPPKPVITYPDLPTQPDGMDEYEAEDPGHKGQGSDPNLPETDAVDCREMHETMPEFLKRELENRGFRSVNVYPISIDDGRESLDPNEPIEIKITFNHKP